MSVTARAWALSAQDFDGIFGHIEEVLRKPQHFALSRTPICGCISCVFEFSGAGCPKLSPRLGAVSDDVFLIIYPEQGRRALVFRSESEPPRDCEEIVLTPDAEAEAKVGLSDE